MVYGGPGGGGFQDFLQKLIGTLDPGLTAPVQVAPRGETADWQGAFNRNWIAGNNAIQNLGSEPTMLGGPVDVSPPPLSEAPDVFRKNPALYSTLMKLFHPADYQRWLDIHDKQRTALADLATRLHPGTAPGGGGGKLMKY